MPNIKKRLAWVTAGYWVLLAYIIAALVWWYIALQKQNAEMTRLRITVAGYNDSSRQTQLTEAWQYQQRKHTQYIGEGIIFLALILVGAVLVYRAIRTYFRLTQQQQHFMMAVTHELKTPIAVARLSLETMQRRQLQPDQTEKLIGQALHETDRLNDLCNNILLASRLEGDTVSGHQEPVNLSTLAEEACRQYHQRFVHHNISSHIQPNVVIQGDASLLQMMLNNLVENAVKYTPRQTRIAVNLYSAAGLATMEVTDEGPGIPAAERKKVFDKFYRIGQEAQRSAKGTGLGLYLVKRIVQRHRGTVSLDENSPQGCRFTLTFPAIGT